MSDKIIQQILSDSEFPSQREDSIRGMAHVAFQKRFRSILIGVVFFSVLFTALAVWVAVLYFRADETWNMVLYATLFNVLILTLGGTRLALWQTMHRGILQRDIRRLELRVTELTKFVAKNAD